MILSETGGRALLLPVLEVKVGCRPGMSKE